MTPSSSTSTNIYQGSAARDASHTWDILGIGSSTVDDILFIDSFPRPDEKMPIRRSLRRAGGQTSTALAAAARLGARVSFCTCLGEEDLSQFMLGELKKNGVGCQHVTIFPGSRPFYAVILIDSSQGSRTILYSNEGFREIDPAAIDPQWIASSRVVLTDHNTPHAGLHAARLARDLHIPVVADLERTNIDGLADLLPMVDHLIVSQRFARDYTGLDEPAAMTANLARKDQAACVVTCGSRGCWYSLNGGPVRHFPAFEVQVVDTTGCGDVFHGAYAAALARGDDIERAIVLASAAAALKATNSGGWSGLPDLEQSIHLAAIAT